MKEIIKIFGFMSCILLFACARDTSENKKDGFKMQKDFVYVHMIPDSLRTPEQEKLYQLILKTVVLNTKVENNHMVFKLSEKEFVQLGIPKQYYDRLQHDIKNNNHLIDSLGIKGVDSLLYNSDKDLYKRFEEKETK